MRSKPGTTLDSVRKQSSSARFAASVWWGSVLKLRESAVAAADLTDLLLDQLLIKEADPKQVGSSSLFQAG
jgi:hypothetical protein